MNSDAIEISCDCPLAVGASLGRLVRVESVRFSPNNRRLALVDYGGESIAIVDVEIAIDGVRPKVTLSAVTEFSSPLLKAPHSVDFLDDETIIVANRGGSITMMRLPSHDPMGNGTEPQWSEPPLGRGSELVNGPGSLTVVNKADGSVEVLICNNYGNTVTRHSFAEEPSVVPVGDVLLRRWLAFPDGVAVSADDRWIAVSNHFARSVMLYERSSSLQESSDPDAILRGAAYPHDLCFSADVRHLFVADSGSPYVHVYARDGQTWKGVHHPVVSLRVMHDDLFRLGSGPEDGGSKGIDIDRCGHVLAVTAEHQPLAFFDVSAILERDMAQCRDHALQVSYELDVLEQTRNDRASLEARLEARIAALEGSRSFRLTKPLRRLQSAWSRWTR